MAAPPATAAGPGSIGDYVWHDVSGNGLQDEWEPGVEGITVTLYDAEGDELLRTVTDSEGQYQFTDLTLGEYQVGFGALAENASYTTPNVGPDRERDSDAHPESGRTAWVTLTELPSITVRLYDAAGVLVDRQLTDHNGNYTFNNLAYGTYEVRVDTSIDIGLIYESGNRP